MSMQFREGGQRPDCSSRFKSLNLVCVIACDTLDVAAVQAQVVQHTVVQGVQLTNCLVVGGPFAESFCDVHFHVPFQYDYFDELCLTESLLEEQLVFSQSSHAVFAGRVNEF